MKQKKELATGQKEYPIDQLIVLPLNIFTRILLNCSFKIGKIYLTKKYFLKDLLRHGKGKNKSGKVWVL